MYSNAPVTPAPVQNTAKDLVFKIINYVVGGILAVVTVMSFIDLTKIADLVEVISTFDSDIEIIFVFFAIAKVLLILGYLFITLALLLKKRGLAIAGFIISTVYGFIWTLITFILAMVATDEGEDYATMIYILFAHFLVFAVSCIIACSAIGKSKRRVDSKAWIAPVVCLGVAWILSVLCYSTVDIVLEEFSSYAYGMFKFAITPLEKFIDERIIWFSVAIFSMGYAVFGVGYSFANERAKLAQKSVPVQPVYQQPVYQQPVYQVPVAPVQPARPVQPVAPTQPVPAAPAQPVAPTQPAAPTQDNTLAAELKRYKDLLDAGVISEEDYNEKKRQLLGL